MICDVDDGHKKCNERRGKKQKSQPSLDDVSRQPTAAKSTDTVQSIAADVAAVDSESTVTDSNVAASEDVGRQQEHIIGLFVADSLPVLSV